MPMVPQGATKALPDSARQDSIKNQIVQQYLDSVRRDSVRKAALQGSAPVDTNRSAMPLPEMRTPQNSGYLIAALLLAGSIYTLYVVILLRRWSALRLRQTKNTPRATR